MSDKSAERIANNDFGDAEAVTTRELRGTLAEVIGRVAYGGDRFVVRRNGKPVAAIVPLEDMFVAQYLEDRLDAQAAGAASSEANAKGWFRYEELAAEFGWE
jgi:prevent-host-death family protein